MPEETLRIIERSLINASEFCGNNPAYERAKFVYDSLLPVIQAAIRMKEADNKEHQK